MHPFNRRNDAESKREGAKKKIENNKRIGFDTEPLKLLVMCGIFQDLSLNFCYCFLVFCDCCCCFIFYSSQIPFFSREFVSFFSRCFLFWQASCCWLVDWTSFVLTLLFMCIHIYSMVFRVNVWVCFVVVVCQYVSLSLLFLFAWD